MMKRLVMVRGGRDERGSVSIVTAGVMVVMAVLSLASVDLLRALDGSARAQTAADAAALAAAREIAIPSGESPDEAAARYASLNGARLLSCRCEAGTGEAVAEVTMTIAFVMFGPDRSVRARARAVIEGA